MATPILGVGCSSAETKECHEKMAAAQSIVSTVESTSIESLNRSLGSVQTAEAACRRAKREREAGELASAREQLKAQVERLEERATRNQRKELEPAEVEKLTRNGDPNCPKGQAYFNKSVAKEIRCVGPQIVEMNWERAKHYFATRNFRVVPTEEPTSLTMESGAERYVFRYDRRESADSPQCLVIYPKPGIPWQEAVARATGSPPDRVKDGGTISLPSGIKLTLRVDEKHQVARIGNCPH